MIERLHDPAARARMRKDLLTPTKEWDNGWQSVPGPEAILIASVNNPALKRFEGK